MIRPYTPTSETGETFVRLWPGMPNFPTGSWVQLPKPALQLLGVAVACHFMLAPACRSTILCIILRVPH